MRKFGIIIYLLLKKLQPGKILSANLPIDELIKIAVDNKEGVIASNGALVVTTGKRTGRSPAGLLPVLLPVVTTKAPLLAITPSLLSTAILISSSMGKLALKIFPGCNFFNKR